MHHGPPANAMLELGVTCINADPVLDANTMASLHYALTMHAVVDWLDILSAARLR